MFLCMEGPRKGGNNQGKVRTQSISQDFGEIWAFKGSLPNGLDYHELYKSSIFMFRFIACRISQILDLLQEVEQE
jgi:hypothetical protein